MGCGKIRAKDVGRKGHHYIKLSIKGGKSKAIGGLKTYKKRKR